MRSKLVYSCSVKICASGFSELLESIFYLLLVLEAFSLQKAVEMLEEVAFGWREVRWTWQMRQNFMAQFIQLLKHWLWDMWSGIVVENWAHSVGQCWLQFSVHPLNLLGVLLTCNGFTWIQKALVDQLGKRPPNRDHDLFLMQNWLWEVLWNFFSVQSSRWAGHHRLSYAVHFLLHITSSGEMVLCCVE